MKRGNIKYGAATVDEKFFVIVGGESVLDFAALTTVRFEAGEGTEWEGGERECKVNSEQ